MSAASPGPPTADTSHSTKQIWATTARSTSRTATGRACATSGRDSPPHGLHLAIASPSSIPPASCTSCTQTEATAGSCSTATAQCSTPRPGPCRATGTCVLRAFPPLRRLGRQGAAHRYSHRLRLYEAPSLVVRRSADRRRAAQQVVGRATRHQEPLDIREPPRRQLVAGGERVARELRRPLPAVRDLPHVTPHEQAADARLPRPRHRRGRRPERNVVQGHHHRPCRRRRAVGRRGAGQASSEGPGTTPSSAATGRISSKAVTAPTS